MAERTLRMIFRNRENTNKTITINVSRADDTKAATVIWNAMNAIYTNREVFSADIGEPVSAAFVTPMQLDSVPQPV